MKNTLIIAAVIFLVGIGGVYLYNRSQQSADSMMEKTETPKQEELEKKEAMMQKNEESVKKDGSMMSKSGNYAEYSKAALDQAVDSRRVLFFYANWCPVCKPADADFQQNSSKIPGDVTVIRVNYNDSDTGQDEKDLAVKYGITYQHTFVQIDKNGKEVTKWNGGMTDKLLSSIK